MLYFKFNIHRLVYHRGESVKQLFLDCLQGLCQYMALYYFERYLPAAIRD